MTILMIERPAIEPVSLEEARDHLRVTATNEDFLIERIIKAARTRLELNTNRAFVEQTLEYRMEDFPACAPYRFSLPRPNLIEVESIKYLDVDGNLQTLDAANYVVIENGDWPAMIQPASTLFWPQVTDDRPDAVRVRYRAGFAPTTESPPDPTGNFPEDLKHAILLLVGHYYENREEIVLAEGRQTFQKNPDAVQALISSWEVHTVA